MINAFRHTLPGQEENNPGFFVRDILRFFAVDLIITASVKLLLFLGFFPAIDSYVVAILGGKVILFVYLVWLVRDRRAAWPATGAVTLGRWWAWPASIIMYFVFVPLYPFIERANAYLLTRAYAALGRVFVPEVQDAIALIFGDALAAPARVALIAFAVLIGPFMEELAFRGVGLNAYRRGSGAVWAVVWTSLLFGLYHFSLQLVIPLGMLGAVFALARLMSGSLWCAFMVHVLHNFLALALDAKKIGIIDFPWPF